MKRPVIQFALNDYCSHRCWYCISAPTWEGSKTGYIDKIGLDKYFDFLMGFTQGHTCTFRFGGQEPTEHPLFYPLLLKLLATEHYIEVITNGLKLEDILTDEIIQYKNKIKWEMSYHLGMYIFDYSSSREDKWNGSFIKAVKCGSVQLVIPMTPGLLRDELNLDDLFNTLRDAGDVTFELIEFYYKDYPRAYTQEEKQRWFELRNEYQEPISMEEIESIININRVMYLKGMPCYYMNRIVNIMYDGSTRLCGAGFPPKIGAGFKIKNHASPCDYDSCNCISLGYENCLKPLGMNYTDYLLLNRPEIKKTFLKKAMVTIKKHGL